MNMLPTYIQTPTHHPTKSPYEKDNHHYLLSTYYIDCTTTVP